MRFFLHLARILLQQANKSNEWKEVVTLSLGSAWA